MNYRTIKLGYAKGKQGISIEPETVYFNNQNVNALKSNTDTYWIKDSALNPLVPITNTWTRTATATYKGTDGGIVTANADHNGSYPCYYAFDGKDTTLWRSLSGYNISESYPHWIQYKLTKATSINMIKIKGTNITVKGKVQGSNDGKTFTDIITIDVNNTNIYYMLPDNKYSDPYLYYRITFTKYNQAWGDMGAVGGTRWYYFIELSELQFYKTI